MVTIYEVNCTQKVKSMKEDKTENSFGQLQNNAQLHTTLKIIEFDADIEQHETQ